MQVIPKTYSDDHILMFKCYRPLPNLPWSGWWFKGFLFSAEANLPPGAVIYFDLDTIILGPWDYLHSLHNNNFMTLSAGCLATTEGFVLSYLLLDLNNYYRSSLWF
jgi:hypothetical protein